MAKKPEATIGSSAGESETGENKAGASKAGKSKASKAAENKGGEKRTVDSPAAGSKPRHGAYFFFFGVVLPLFAMLFETTTHFCAQNFFDPFPSNGHVLLFSLIPFSNFLTWLAGRRDLSAHCFFRSLLSGMAMGIGVLYTLMFLPITPKCCMGVLFLGFGLLGLAPILSLPCSWLSGKDVCHLADAKKTYFNAHQVEHIGHLIILVMVIAVELPSTLTRVHLAEAVKNLNSGNASAIVWLRQWGSKEVMLRACYERSGRATDILGSLYENSHPLNVEAVRDVFYKVTGQPYNAVAIPASARATLKHADIKPDSVFNQGVDDEFDLDNDVAGESVATVARGLSAKQAAVKARIDSVRAIATINWSISFKNDSEFDREARFKLHLPADGVVTRATLTMDGTSREASVMARQAARTLYKQQAARKLDPLLVSVSGRDELLVQSYPVRPGSDVRIDLEIAAPMQLDPAGGEALSLPVVCEQNFKNDLAVDVDLLGYDAFDIFPRGLTQGLVAGVGGSGDNIFSNEVTGKCSLKDLTAYGAVLHLPSKIPQFAQPLKAGEGVLRNIMPSAVEYCPMTYPDHNIGYVTRKLEALHYKGGDKIAVVIDGSVSMQEYMPQIAKCLKSLSANNLTENISSITVIGDEPEELLKASEEGFSDSARYAQALDKLSNYRTAGGQDCSQYLAVLCKQDGHGNIIWIHGPQPAAYSKNSALSVLQPGELARIFDVQLIEGPNDIAANLKTQPNFIRLPKFRNLNEDLSALIKDLHIDKSYTDSTQFASTPSNIWSLATSSSASGSGCDDRLAKIWLNKQISADLIDADTYVMVNTLGIVTPISSAIVVSTDTSSELFRNRLRPIKFNLGSDPIESIKKYLNEISTVGSVATAPENMQYLEVKPTAPELEFHKTTREFFRAREASDAASPEEKPLQADKEVAKLSQEGSAALSNLRFRGFNGPTSAASVAAPSSVAAQAPLGADGAYRKVAEAKSPLNRDEISAKDMQQESFGSGGALKKEYVPQYETSEPGVPTPYPEHITSVADYIRQSTSSGTSTTIATAPQDDKNQQPQISLGATGHAESRANQQSSFGASGPQLQGATNGTIAPGTSPILPGAISPGAISSGATSSQATSSDASAPGATPVNPPDHPASFFAGRRQRHVHGFLDATPIVMWVGIIFLIFGGVALLMGRSQRKR